LRLLYRLLGSIRSPGWYYCPGSGYFSVEEDGAAPVRQLKVGNSLRLRRATVR